MDYDVIIAGGGLNGSALALALASAGLEVAVVDPLPVEARVDPGFDGRSYALALASQRLLGALGLWEGLAAQAQPILEIKVSDGRAGEGPSPFVLEFDHAEIEEGPMGFLVEDRHLRRALLDALTGAGVTHVSGARIAGHMPGPAGVEVSLEGARALHARMLVGADGAASATAQRAGVKRTGWEYGQTALVAAVAHAYPHRGIAHQFFMPAGPLAILPLTGDRCSIVWTETDAEAARIQALDDAGYLAELRPRFGGFLGGIELAGARFTYPLGLSLAQSFVADRVALIGDAAHRVHPIAGQGLNAGLKDVAALAEVLTLAMRRGEDIGRADVLERYQAWRRFDVAALAAATDGFNRLFSNDLGGLRVTRDLGLAAVNALPGVRRGFIREAAGLTGDLPRLLQGEIL
ncbi:2-octaprenyl-6-methoxyphenol hydroxylase [Candidatus Rhodobacter oscarellae]|uniref:2-octaprenyl-6-methoxyphenol hydroxylase n=1 Tax=Candidatus Rhodobacter oscarellae TaxID=1675527 RepID=A0A0J9GYM6_9RHOB|nr:FAD-dependent monooxygenase [Candidatus Rhodobacter lobularis]KMW58598.1 2-octaprenyl-6-methoxyphenol hydroxylase [Candidatus Rhodobacter lobularis]